ncbi:MAG: segregation/condensation protein A [Peptoniphilus duerdenii]|uniref:segregation and condensation protein A n=1 Tax=Peptoniphilus duerdenii TaxID=507750 RepID=UPI00254D6A39|nr:segregation/condensation protein A [Peptoniphilus duerdenii]MDK8275987.1 segregation/condensation protein A [Peptoniphilus duerdenii]
MGYNISLKSYEGPMDLLLDLIKKNEVDIYDIPIHLITEQFLEYLNLSKTLNMDITSDFILMAATLIEIKSKMLLPKHQDEDESEEETEDPRQELVQKILEYEKFREVSSILKTSHEFENKSIYKLQEDFSSIDDVDFIKNLTTDKLAIAFSNIIKNMKAEEKNYTIRTELFTNKMAMNIIKEKLKSSKKLSFVEVVKDQSLENIITYFLAILELAKNGKVTLDQNKDLSDILILRR